jgi:hypothetical protein
MSDDIIQDAKVEIKGMAKEGMHHPSTKPVLIGGAVGAAVGMFTFVSVPVGILLGAGAMLYKRLRP